MDLGSREDECIHQFYPSAMTDLGGRGRNPRIDFNNLKWSH